MDDFRQYRIYILELYKSQTVITAFVVSALLNVLFDIGQHSLRKIVYRFVNGINLPLKSKNLPFNIKIGGVIEK